MIALINLCKSSTTPVFLKSVLILVMIFCFAQCRDVDSVNGDEDWSFVVIGDIRQGYGLYSKVVTYIGRIDPVPEFAICLGDIMLRPANDADWINFWHYSKPMTDKMPLYMVRGNHEGNDPASEDFLRKQMNVKGENFYYTFSCNNACFIVLDTERKGEEGSIGEKQLLWLRHELDSTEQDNAIQNIFIFMHHPLYPQGAYKGSNLKNADELHALFLQHLKIEAVIAGHDHVFNRYVLDGLTYLETCGLEASLYHGSGGDYYHFLKVSFYSKQNRINIKTIGVFNEVIEDFDL
jgi:hypothetical protein